MGVWTDRPFYVGPIEAERWLRENVTGAEVLAVPLTNSSSGQTTVRSFLIELARKVWLENEDFSGKRPFGLSGWWDEIGIALADAGMLVSDEDRWGELTYDEAECDRLIGLALDELAREPS